MESISAIIEFVILRHYCAKWVNVHCEGCACLYVGMLVLLTHKTFIKHCDNGQLM